MQTDFLSIYTRLKYYNIIWNTNTARIIHCIHVLLHPMLRLSKLLSSLWYAVCNLHAITTVPRLKIETNWNQKMKIYSWENFACIHIFKLSYFPLIYTFFHFNFGIFNEFLYFAECKILSVYSFKFRKAIRKLFADDPSAVSLHAPASKIAAGQLSWG